MGGGDLNLKKSWHPSTLRNIERVWKAEQKHEAEQKKIEQLQKELAEERARDEIRQYAEDKGVVQKRAERLDWMYQGPAAMVNREDYLLGRSVDKTFDILQESELGIAKQQDGEDNVPGMVVRRATGENVTIDLENKIREDPLLQIKKQEEESKRRLLDNPVKMKQLQELLLKFKEKKLKKKKKSKKHKRKPSDSESSDDSVSYKHKSSKRSRNSYKKQSLEHDHRNERIEYVKKERNDKRENKYVSRHNSYSRRDYKSNSEFRSRSPLRKRSRSPKNDSKRYEHSSKKTTKRMTDEERNEKLKEMMMNAKWRDDQRKVNIKHYKEEEQKERETQMKGSNRSFIKPLLNAAADSSTVESRIKSNMYNIQRTKSALDSNFARR